VTLLLPDDLADQIADMENRDPGIVRSIVRTIFGSHSGSHFGVRKINLRRASTFCMEAKKKQIRIPWDKSCL
jgi:hypothetical protein